MGASGQTLEVWALWLACVLRGSIWVSCDTNFERFKNFFEFSDTIWHLKSWSIECWCGKSLHTGIRNRSEKLQKQRGWRILIHSLSHKKCTRESIRWDTWAQETAPWKSVYQVWGSEFPQHPNKNPRRVVCICYPTSGRGWQEIGRFLGLTTHASLVPLRDPVSKHSEQCLRNGFQGWPLVSTHMSTH